MQGDEREWIISYTLSSDLTSVITIQLKALPEFNEVGEYSQKECEEVLKLIHSTPLPEFKKKYWWGAKTLEEWEDFNKTVQDKIKEYAGQ